MQATGSQDLRARQKDTKIFAFTHMLTQDTKKPERKAGLA